MCFSRASAAKRTGAAEKSVTEWTAETAAIAPGGKFVFYPAYCFISLFARSPFFLSSNIEASGRSVMAQFNSAPEHCCCDSLVGGPCPTSTFIGFLSASLDCGFSQASGHCKRANTTALGEQWRLRLLLGRRQHLNLRFVRQRTRSMFARHCARALECD